jgi:GT2 family glycosyltransferase
MKCLQALARQDLDPGDYEIVVADDAASEATRNFVAELAKQSPARMSYVPVTEAHGPAAARNCGWRQARGEYLAFTDDDCEPAPDWLRNGLSALEHGADAAAGRVVVPRPVRPTDYERDVAGLERAEFVTANCFCRRAALEAVGGFDEAFRAAWREDSDLHFSLLEAGYTVVRAENAVVVHPVRPATWGVSLKQQRKAIFEALLYKKHPRLYRQRIGTLSASYYGSVAALATAGAGLGWAADSVLWAGLGVWAALTARFCGLRLRGTSWAPAHVAEMAFTSVLIPPLSLYWRLRGAWRYRALVI